MTVQRPLYRKPPFTKVLGQTQFFCPVLHKQNQGDADFSRQGRLLSCSTSEIDGNASSFIKVVLIHEIRAYCLYLSKKCFCCVNFPSCFCYFTLMAGKQQKQCKCTHSQKYHFHLSLKKICQTFERGRLFTGNISIIFYFSTFCTSYFVQ